MIYKPAYDVNFIFVEFFKNWNRQEKHLKFYLLPIWGRGI